MIIKLGGTCMANNRENSINVCECNIIHEDKLNSVKEEMLDSQTFDYMGELFKSFGDSTRLKILYALANEELCVCDIATLLNMTQSAISHQLRVLRNVRLVKNRKEGKTVYYSLDDDHVFSILKQGIEHVEHTM
jgi:ArsR family transcriptional regulator